MHQSLVYLFLCQRYRYHSNNSYGKVCFSNSSHYSSKFSVQVLLLFARNFEIVRQNYALKQKIEFCPTMQ